MKSIRKIAFMAVLGLFVASCTHTPEIYKGFEKTSTGAYMRFYERGSSDVAPRIGDGVSFEMAQYFGDSLIFTTVGDTPIEIILEPSAFVGDVSDALQAMHIGDSARVVILADSVFTALGNYEVPEEYFGKPLYYDLKLLSIEPKEVLEAENRRVLDSLRLAEQTYLDSFRSDPKSQTTASGLIVVDRKGSGKSPQLGDYVDFDFLISTKDGDTLLSSLDYESVLMQYGEEFICKGINEALGMTPQGGVVQVIIPSELGFDSVGYQGLVMPYEPMVAKLMMKEVMDKETYGKRTAAREAAKEAERKSLLAKEDQQIKNYLKTNGIIVEPTESGLYIIREAEGVGTEAEWGDAVVVHYVMSNLKGDKVESSYDIGEPMRFTIGQGEMLPCIEEAVMTMSPGARVLLVSPSELGFGEFAVHQELLPAFSPLVVELELVAIE